MGWPPPWPVRPCDSAAPLRAPWYRCKGTPSSSSGPRLAVTLRGVRTLELKPGEFTRRPGNQGNQLIHQWGAIFPEILPACLAGAAGALTLAMIGDAAGEFVED